ncbi:MAG TPA: cyclic nucleotide-binding domain-containing protein [Chthoniobacterales bacterium]|nr:cyclic nucleotide-binding domain-containing protein [Chthoniobacterales bacterium]
MNEPPPVKLVGESLTFEQLVEYLPPLKEVLTQLPSKKVMEWAEDAAVLHRYRKGETVCTEGEFGSTAYYIVSGTVDISINNPLAHLRTKPGWGFFGRSVARMKSFLVDDRRDKRADAHERKYIGIDANVDLPMNKPIAQLGAGELFGDMTCRTFQPRSATVITREPCVMVEMLRVILDMLVGNRQLSDASKATSKVKAPTFKGTSFKAELDRKYRERSLEIHLRSVPLFATVGDEFISYLKDKVELVSYNQSQVICKEGEEADAFYLIRSGMVRISMAMPGGEMVRTYLSRGEYFGEIGLLWARKRIATCTALDAVDVVKVPAGEFKLMLEKFPGVRALLEPVAEARIAVNKNRMAPPGLGLDEFLNQGLFEAQNLLLIDLDNCTRCDACVQACAKAHDGVSRLLRDGLRYDHFLVATACRSCRDPLCMTQCPVGSIRRKENLEIIIEDWCIGCGKCAELCPYGNINMHPLEVIKEVKTEVKSSTAGVPPTVKIEKKKTTAYKANTCDLCTQLSVPSCVYACPHDAAKRVDPQRFFGDALEAQAEILKTNWKPERRYETHTTH